MLTDEELRELEEWASKNALHTCKRLLAEVRELRLLLRDAVQDSTPGNRLWRAGAKAGLMAAALACHRAANEMSEVGDFEAGSGASGVAEYIFTIDPATILP